MGDALGIACSRESNDASVAGENNGKWLNLGLEK